jgi:hypothetical protein
VRPGLVFTPVLIAHGKAPSLPSLGGPSGPVEAPPEVTARFDHPSGALTQDNVAGLWLRFLDFAVFLPSANGLMVSSTCPAQSAHELDGTCACAGGGSFSYHAEKGVDGADTTVAESWQEAKCASGASTYEGTVNTYARATPLGQMDGDQIIMFDLTATTNGVATPIEFGARVGGANDDILMPLDGRDVIIRQGVEPTMYILDRAGRWTCDGSSDHGTCTLDGASPPQSVTF